ncbi:MAG: ATP-binding protein [Halobacteriales archaeon]
MFVSELSRRDLGTVYLFSLAVGFMLAVVGNLYLYPYPLRDIPIGIGLATGVLLAIGLAYLGIEIYRSNLSDDQVWIISQWSSIGLGITTLLAVIWVFTFDLRTTPRPAYFLNLSAAGGVVGALVASVRSLRMKNHHTRRLHRRTTVLQRVLRHNIRNSVNVMQGYAGILENHLQGTNEEMAESIRRQADSVARISETVRDFTSLDADRTTRPIDIVALLDTQLDTFAEYHPYVTIERAMPEMALGWVDDLFEVAVWHLLETLIRYNDCPDPTFSITVTTDSDTVIIRISDNETAIPEQVLTAIRQGQETQLEHTDGVGLWLATWLIDDYGGVIHFDEGDVAGVDIRVTIPKAAHTTKTTEAAEVVV